MYTVWYTNSTEFCVSPAVSWDPLCPNAIFIPQNSVQTKTIQSMSCPVSGEGGPLLVRIVTNQGVPVQNQQVQVVHRGPTVNEQYCGTVSLPALITNSSGWVKVPGGDGLPYAGSFSVSFVYSAQSYDGLVTIEPLATTYVTFYVPSGQEATMYCPLDNCPTYSDSMTMGG